MGAELKPMWDCEHPNLLPCWFHPHAPLDGCFLRLCQFPGLRSQWASTQICTSQRKLTTAAHDLQPSFSCIITQQPTTKHQQLNNKNTIKMSPDISKRPLAEGANCSWLRITGRGLSFGARQTWLLLRAPPITSYWSLGNILNFTQPHLLFCDMKIKNYFARFYLPPRPSFFLNKHVRKFRYLAHTMH